MLKLALAVASIVLTPAVYAQHHEEGGHEELRGGVPHDFRSGFPEIGRRHVGPHGEDRFFKDGRWFWYGDRCFELCPGASCPAWCY